MSNSYNCPKCGHYDTFLHKKDGEIKNLCRHCWYDAPYEEAKAAYLRQLEDDFIDYGIKEKLEK
jgi:hypothetical protein